jgi:pimeloyl-ACP methyl ester carboxylesterase
VAIASSSLREQAAEAAVTLKKVIGSPGYPLDEPAVRDVGRRSFERDRGAEEDAARQRMPVLVIHGEQDPIIRPKGGRSTAQAIPGARLVTYPGMGHDLPRALWPAILEEISALAGQAGETQHRPAGRASS